MEPEDLGGKVFLDSHDSNPRQELGGLKWLTGDPISWVELKLNDEMAS